MFFLKTETAMSFVDIQKYQNPVPVLKEIYRRLTTSSIKGHDYLLEPR